MINQHMNWNYDGDIPANTNDRYYTQDKITDMRYLESLANMNGYVSAFASGYGSFLKSIIIDGFIIYPIGNSTIGYLGGVGYHTKEVEIMDDFNNFPPSKKTIRVPQLCRLVSGGSSFDASTQWVNDNITRNYIKVRTIENNNLSREKAKEVSTYFYDRLVSTEIYIDQVAPVFTNSDYITLGSFVTVGGVLPSFFDYSINDRSAKFETYPFIGSVCMGLQTYFLEPSKYKLANGQQVLKDQFPDLYIMLGDAYGPAPGGSAYFKLPDLRGYFPRFQDLTAGRDPGPRTDRGDGVTGDNIGTLEGDTFQGHRHYNNGYEWDGTGQPQEAIKGPTEASGNRNVAAESVDVGAIIINTDGVRAPLSEPGYGTPRYGVETRPKNIAVSPYIRVS